MREYGTEFRLVLPTLNLAADLYDEERTHAELWPVFLAAPDLTNPNSFYAAHCSAAWSLSPPPQAGHADGSVGR